MKIKRSSLFRISKKVITVSALALLTASAPLSLSLSGDLLTDNAAFAKGGGGGGGGGNGGGNGNAGGNGNNGQGVGANAAEAGPGIGQGHSKGDSDASALGALNAAHASSTGQANAAPNSRVGLVNTYHNLADEIAKAETTEDQQDAIDEAGKALAAAANKSINKDVVQNVNETLGVTMDDETAQAIADAANAPTEPGNSEPTGG